MSAAMKATCRFKRATWFELGSNSRGNSRIETPKAFDSEAQRRGSPRTLENDRRREDYSEGGIPCGNGCV